MSSTPTPTASPCSTPGWIKSSPPGICAPTSCAVDGDRVYVTLTYNNAVAVLDRRSGKSKGLIPTGWYPTKVLVEGGRLLTLSAKGIRPRRPNPHGPQPATGPRNGPDYV